MQKHKQLQVDFCLFICLFYSGGFVYFFHHFSELKINIGTEMKATSQLSVKEEGQRRERPSSALKVEGISSQLVSDTLGVSTEMQTFKITYTANYSD